VHCKCPLLGVKRTSIFATHTSAFGPKWDLPRVRTSPHLAHAASFAIEFLQDYFRERWCRIIAQLHLAGGATRKGDVNHSSSNPVAAVNGMAIFVRTADVDVY